MKIPVLEGHRRVFYHGEKTPTDSALWWQTRWTYTSWGERRWLSWQHFLLQVNVLGGAGVLQMFLVVFLEGSSAEKTDRWEQWSTCQLLEDSNPSCSNRFYTVMLSLFTKKWLQTQRMLNQNSSRANTEALLLIQMRVIVLISSALIVGSIPTGWQADGWNSSAHPILCCLPSLHPKTVSLIIQTPYSWIRHD